MSGLLEIKDIFLAFCRKQVGNGMRTHFWQDEWVGNSTIAEQFILHLQKKIIVAKAFEKGWDFFKFRRILIEDIYS